MPALFKRAMLVAVILVSGLDFPAPEEYDTGTLCDGINGECRDAPEPATTCADAITEAEISDLCGDVPPCDDCGALVAGGCYHPVGLECDP